MRTFLGFIIGVLTTLTVLGGIVIWNCFGVYTETKVVYYKFFDFPSYSAGDYEKTGYMSPYISENGKFCRFIDGQIVEIG